LNRLIKEGERVMKAAFKIFFLSIVLFNGLYGMSDFDKQCKNLEDGLSPYDQNMQHMLLENQKKHVAAFKAWVDGSRASLNLALGEGLSSLTVGGSFGNLYHAINSFYAKMLGQIRPMTKNAQDDEDVDITSLLILSCDGSETKDIAFNMLMLFFRTVEPSLLKQVLQDQTDVDFYIMLSDPVKGYAFVQEKLPIALNNSLAQLKIDFGIQTFCKELFNTCSDIFVWWRQKGQGRAEDAEAALDMVEEKMNAKLTELSSSWRGDSAQVMRLLGGDPAQQVAIWKQNAVFKLDPEKKAKADREKAAAATAAARGEELVRMNVLKAKELETRNREVAAAAVQAAKAAEAAEAQAQAEKAKKDAEPVIARINGVAEALKVVNVATGDPADIANVFVQTLTELARYERIDPLIKVELQKLATALQNFLAKFNYTCQFAGFDFGEKSQELLKDLTQGLKVEQVLWVTDNSRRDDADQPRYFACNSAQDCENLKKLYTKSSYYSFSQGEMIFSRFISYCTGLGHDLRNEYLILGDQFCSTLLDNIQSIRAKYERPDSKDKRLLDVIKTIAAQITPELIRKTGSVLSNIGGLFDIVQNLRDFVALSEKTSSIGISFAVGVKKTAEAGVKFLEEKKLGDKEQIKALKDAALKSSVVAGVGGKAASKKPEIPKRETKAVAPTTVGDALQKALEMLREKLKSLAGVLAA